MGLFSRKLIDHEVVEWQFDWFSYLIDNFSSGPGLPDAELWLPVKQDFGHEDGRELHGQALADFTYSKITQQFCLPEDFPVKLIVTDSAPTGFLGDSAILKNEEKSACGLYQLETNDDGTYREIIMIDGDLLKSPINLIATLSHELSHAMHNRAFEPYDGDPLLYELFTDLSAVYFGYGVFLANSRFQFETSGQGWQAQGAGYLPESDLIFANALFMKIKNIAPEVAAKHLKPRLVKMLTQAFKQLERYENDVCLLRDRVPKHYQRPS